MRGTPVHRSGQTVPLDPRSPKNPRFRPPGTVAGGTTRQRASCALPMNSGIMPASLCDNQARERKAQITMNEQCEYCGAPATADTAWGYLCRRCWGYKVFLATRGLAVAHETVTGTQVPECEMHLETSEDAGRHFGWLPHPRF